MIVKEIAFFNKDTDQNRSLHELELTFEYEGKEIKVSCLGKDVKNCFESAIRALEDIEEGEM